MDNLTIQYIIVGCIILGAVIWLFIRIRRDRKRGSACHGCSMSDCCTKNYKRDKDCL